MNEELSNKIQKIIKNHFFVTGCGTCSNDNYIQQAGIKGERCQQCFNSSDGTHYSVSNKWAVTVTESIMEEVEKYANNKKCNEKGSTEN